MTETPDIFAARAAVAAEVKAHQDASLAAIAESRQPTEDFPNGLFPDGLTQDLAQVEAMARYVSPRLAPPPEPEAQPEPED